MNKQSYSEHFINGKSVNLHYLDWGGSGQPLVLIHGLGDTPYIFADLADSLSKHFRVISYSRRGHCKTECADSGYDNTTLTTDLKLLLDSLQIDKANLLGWSMGGNEITEFAIRYPARTGKLIYLEAGYDLSESEFRLMIDRIPTPPFPDSLSLSSVEAYRKWYYRFWFPDIEWNATLEANLQASIKTNPDGSVKTLPDDKVSGVILKEAMNYHRNYKLVYAPALIFFTNSFFEPPANDSNTVALYKNLEKDIINPWRQKSIKRIKAEFRDATVKTMTRGSHCSLIFVSKEFIIESINDFLIN